MGLLNEITLIGDYSLSHPMDGKIQMLRTGGNNTNWRLRLSPPMKWNDTNAKTIIQLLLLSCPLTPVVLGHCHCWDVGVFLSVRCHLLIWFNINCMRTAFCRL